MTPAPPTLGEGARLVATALFAVVGLAFLLLLQVSRATTAGYEVRWLLQAKADLEQRTYLLEAEMASLQSLDRIEREARTRLKMQPAQRYLFVSVNEPSREGSAATNAQEAASPHPSWGAILVALGIRRE